MSTLNKFWKIILSQKWGLLLQFGIFLGLAVALAFFMNTMDDNFEFEPVAGVDIAIFDRDQTELSEAFVAHFTELHDIQELEDSAEVWQDYAMFNQIGLIIEIPVGFTDSFLNGDGDLNIEFLMARDGMTGIFVTEQIEQYFRILNIYLAGGFDLTEASALTVDGMSFGVDIQMVEVEEDLLFGSYMFYRFLPITLLIVIGLSIGGIFMALNKEDLIRRIESAPVSLVRRNVERIASCLLLSFMGWGIFIVVSFVLFSEMTEFESILRILNTVPLVFLGIALAFFMTQFVNTRDLLFSGIFTTVFVVSMPVTMMDLDFLADAFLNVLRFTPTYWYARINEMLLLEQVVDWTLFWQGIIIQIAFAAAILAVGMLFSKEKRAKRA